MKKFLRHVMNALFNLFQLIKVFVAAIMFIALFVMWAEWSDEQSKISNQYSAEEANVDLLYDVKDKMSEKYNMPISRLRIARNEKSFGWEYEYFVIFVDEEDQEIERYEIVDSEIQQEIDDCLDGTIPEEELKEKYHIGDDEE